MAAIIANSESGVGEVRRRQGDVRDVARVIAHPPSAEASSTAGASYLVDGAMALIAAQDDP